MMWRGNTFAVRPFWQRDQLLLFEQLDVSAAFWNESTYDFWQALFGNKDVWQVDANTFRVGYKIVLGFATA